MRCLPPRAPPAPPVTAGKRVPRCSTTNNVREPANQWAPNLAPFFILPPQPASILWASPALLSGARQHHESTASHSAVVPRLPGICLAGIVRVRAADAAQPQRLQPVFPAAGYSTRGAERGAGQ